ncbi:Phosphatidate phosphatase APP1 [Mariniphaga anaerophila]|uniref:Phosphatidate phosphatase APP1 n=1 Tax=Mariniphaga anaerophila TaxID=1484053 RepID=A0A1M4WGX1_9BACT|nr:phosphatase domain-containing protein [Mariniphaga anaerophila]SHE80445.1 Phosphatidate phosphatase APP1 [Mariniphaga anaerophila]
MLTLLINKLLLKRNLRKQTAFRIIPYRGYGNEADVFVTGRVTSRKQPIRPQKKHHAINNMLATIKRYSSAGIRGIKVQAVFMEQTKISVTDEYGFVSFHFHFENAAERLLSDRWHTVHFELISPNTKNKISCSATGEVTIIPHQQKRIFISDIDDTVLLSHSTNTRKKLKLMLLKNACTRTPLQGVANFYKALASGRNQIDDNPFFYVSNSEWNLYDFMEDFFDFNSIPKGVFMLRKLKNGVLKTAASKDENYRQKQTKIESLIRFYPNQKFVLFGDNGQQDPLIYNELAKRYPNKIEAVFIRKTDSHSFSQKMDFKRATGQAASKYFEIADTQEAAVIAEKLGLIGNNYFDKKGNQQKEEKKAR